MLITGAQTRPWRIDRSHRGRHRHVLAASMINRISGATAFGTDCDGCVVHGAIHARRVNIRHTGAPVEGILHSRAFIGTQMRFLDSPDAAANVRVEETKAMIELFIERMFAASRAWHRTCAARSSLRSAG